MMTTNATIGNPEMDVRPNVSVVVVAARLRQAVVELQRLLHGAVRTCLLSSLDAHRTGAMPNQRTRANQVKIL